MPIIASSVEGLEGYGNSLFSGKTVECLSESMQFWIWHVFCNTLALVPVHSQALTDMSLPGLELSSPFRGQLGPPPKYQESEDTVSRE